MELDVTKNDHDIYGYKADKLSARMSVFAWILCAVLGWALAFTSFYSLISDEEGDLLITAQTEPSAEDAARMQQVLPAAGNNQ